MKKEQLEEYINEYGKEIYSFCKMLTKNKDEADDLYQETFIKMLELDCLKEDGNPKSYLLGISINLWKNKKRKHAWRRRIADVRSQPPEKLQGEQLSVELVEEQIIAREEAKVVNDAVNKLPDKMRIVILLYYMEGLTIAEIGTELHISASAIKSRLSRARTYLKKELEVLYYE